MSRLLMWQLYNILGDDAIYFDGFDFYEVDTPTQEMAPPLELAPSLSPERSRAQRRRLNDRRQDHGSAAGRCGHLGRDKSWARKTDKVCAQDLRRELHQLPLDEGSTDELRWFWEDSDYYEVLPSADWNSQYPDYGDFYELDHDDDFGQDADYYDQDSLDYYLDDPELD